MNIRAIVSTHLAGIADDITKDIITALGAFETPAARAKKAPKAARAKKAPKARTKTPHAPKATTTHEANAVAIATYVADHPEGVGAEAIRSGTGISKPAWTKAAKAAIAGGVVRTEGQKRTMKYFPVGDDTASAAQ